MLTIGVDAHKSLHVAAALDEAGRVVGPWKGANQPERWQALLDWARPLDRERRWGVEGAWNYGRGLAQFLVGAGEAACEVNPRLTADRRRRARRPDKDDRLDARAVANVLREEELALPRVTADDESAVLELLVTEREAALAEATRLRNQLHQRLLHLDPAYRAALPSLLTPRALELLAHDDPPVRTALDRQRVAAVRRPVRRLRLATEQAEELAAQIRQRAKAHFRPPMQLHGINALTAGALAGILGPGQRFRSEAQLAAYAGAAPLEASSADLVRHRLNRGGNRRLNAIPYRIALTQARWFPDAQRYLARRQAEGKTRREAVRALKRYLIRAICRLWRECAPPPATAAQAA